VIFEKLTTGEQLKSLKKNDLLIVKWRDNAKPANNGEPITACKIWGVNHIDEVVVRRRDNLYFSISMFISGNSFAEEVYLVKDKEE
jgi:hypothetical protein